MKLIVIALQGVRGFWARTLLTGVSLVLGIVILTSTFAASVTIQRTIEQRALLQNGPAATYVITLPPGEAERETAEQLASQLQRFGTRTLTAHTARIEGAQLGAGDGSGAIDADILATDPSLRQIRPFPLVEGDWLGETPTILPRIVVNAQLANDQGLHPGTILRLGTETGQGWQSMMVIGVVEDGALNAAAYVPLDGSWAALGQAVTHQVIVSAPDLTKAQVQARASSIHSLTGQLGQWTVERVDTVDSLEGEVSTAQRGFIIVGLLAAFAAALAVANVGLSALKERSLELSLRRAVGAGRGEIALIMALESQIVALVAGVVAIPFSTGLYWLIGTTMGSTLGVGLPAYPWEFALLGLLVGQVAAAIGSIAPSLRSLTTPVANVIRE